MTEPEYLNREKLLREKLLLVCTKAPEYLELEVYRLLHDFDREGYGPWLNDFILEIHLICGSNVGLLCQAIAKAIMDHQERTIE